MRKKKGTSENEIPTRNEVKKKERYKSPGEGTHFEHFTHANLQMQKD